MHDFFYFTQVDQKAKIESIPDMQQELQEFEDKLKELTA
jgi:hypothetical protein